jgi:MFS family permease
VRGERAWSPAAAQNAVIAAGCLGMVYTQLTMSPATIEYARSLGGGASHIGLLGALPTAMLFMQFLAAAVANHLRYRRPLWLAVSIVQRLVFVPLAVGMWIWPETPPAVWLWTFIALTAVNHALLHFGTPLWLSWMGDYLPPGQLNRLWGARQFWMQWCGAVALFAGAVYLYQDAGGVRHAFAVLLLVGAAFGVADILLFLKVHEPPVTPVAVPRLREVFSAPFRDRNFRSFIAFTSFWHVAAMTGAPFISYYLLTHIGMSAYRVLLLWTFSWVGGAVFSQRMGTFAERYGNRPLLILCTAFKSVNMLTLIVLPADPDLAFWFLVPMFMFDAVLNSGIAIANNGFLIKNSPAANRTMFIAAGTAVAGLVGGLTSIASGFLLESLPARVGTFEAYWLGGAISRFHVVFGISLALRLVAAVLARGVREPSSVDTRVVLMNLIGATPLRILLFPLGLYRNQEVAESQPASIPLPAVAASEPMPEPVPIPVPAAMPAPLPVKSAS